MNDFRCDLTSKKIGIAFNIYDRDGNGEISNEDFLRSTRRIINPERQAISRNMKKKIKSHK